MLNARERLPGVAGFPGLVLGDAELTRRQLPHGMPSSEVFIQWTGNLPQPPTSSSALLVRAEKRYYFPS